MVEDKKNEESAVLEMFREHFRDFPKGVLSATESPDFILSLGPKKKIGIELTRLHKHSADQDLFSFHNISACLLHKESKLKLYRRKKLQEYWLILSIGNMAGKPRYNLSNKLMVWEFETGYNRIFLINTVVADIFELRKKAAG